MNENSEKRYVLFKEQIRRELHENEEYIFSEKFRMNNENSLLQQTRA